MRRFARACVPVLAALAAAGPASAESVEITGEMRLAARDDGVGGRLTGGGEFFVGVRGQSDASRRLVGSLRPTGHACPANEDEGWHSLGAYGGPGYFQGAFETRLLTPAIASGRWRACVYLLDDSGAPVAAADRILEPSMAPRKVYAPRIAISSYGTRTMGVTCNAGEWLAWPRPKVGYAWRVNGRLVRGARRSKLKVRARSRVACRVTLRNAHGRASVWSRTKRV